MEDIIIFFLFDNFCFINLEKQKKRWSKMDQIEVEDIKARILPFVRYIRSLNIVRRAGFWLSALPVVKSVHMVLKRV